MANNYTLRTRVKHKQDTSGNWASHNPTLLEGELAFDLVSGLFKVGHSTDGTEAGLQAYSSLPAYYLITKEIFDDISLIDSIKEKAETQADWTQTDDAAVDFIKNKPELKEIATSGSADDVTVKADFDGSGNESEMSVTEAVVELFDKAGVQSAKKYIIQKAATAESGYAATYKLLLNGEEIVDSVNINIPKDYLVKSASIAEAAEADKPVAGLAVGDKYIDFVVNASDDTGNESHIYLPVNELVDVYKNGNGIEIDGENNVSIKVNATLQNGLALSAEGLGLNLANETTAGAMSAAQVTKLKGIAENANNYTHPETAGNKHVPAGGEEGQILGWSADGTAIWQDAPIAVKSSDEENKVKINEDKTMELTKVNVSILSQTTGDVLILDCGGAAD